jgi:hypothetical protein
MAKTYKQYAERNNFDGPWPLDEPHIETLEDDDYGVYLLTMTGSRGGIIVVYVGRGTIKERLTDHMEDSDATHFYFTLLETEQEGFVEECRLFHKYGKRPHLDNEIHPPVPAGSPASGPKCSEHGCQGEAD